jgi:hypothetical protein
MGHGFTLSQIHALQTRLADWQQLLRFSDDHKLGTPLIKRFWTLLTDTPAMEWDASGRMLFPLEPRHEWQSSDIRRMVWPFVMIDWLKTAYVGEASQKVTEQQALDIAADILPVLQSFGWLKNTKVTIGKRLVREADSFTLGANGNGDLEVSEAVRYLAFVASAYRSSQVWLDRAQAVCHTHAIECVRSVGLSEPVIGILPRLQKSIGSEPPASFLRYMQKAEETILGTPIEGEVGAGDLLQIWMVFQYVETFEKRYDLDGSEVIDLSEADQAFHVFGPVLSRLLSRTGLPDEELRAFFTFLMRYGDTPFTMFGGQIAYNYWKWHPERWKLSADRQVLMAILNQLSKL